MFETTGVVERFTFRPGHPFLEEIRLQMEGRGFTCTLEENTIAGYTLHTLVCVPPIRPNREARGCNLRSK